MPRPRPCSTDSVNIRGRTKSQPTSELRKVIKRDCICLGFTKTSTTENGVLPSLCPSEETSRPSLFFFLRLVFFIFAICSFVSRLLSKTNYTSHYLNDKFHRLPETVLAHRFSVKPFYFAHDLAVRRLRKHVNGLYTTNTITIILQYI